MAEPDISRENAVQDGCRASYTPADTMTEKLSVPVQETGTSSVVWHSRKSSERWKSKLQTLKEQNISPGLLHVVFREDFLITTENHETDVYLGLLGGVTEVAVKRERGSKNGLQDLTNEFEILSTLRSDYIAQCIFPDKMNNWLVFHLYEYTLDELPSMTFKLDRKSVIWRVFSALKLVHKAGIVHRNVKPQSIQIDIMGNARLADFGSSRMEKENSSDIEALDIMGNARLADFGSSQMEKEIASDIEAAGRLLRYILSGGKVPYEATYHYETAKEPEDNMTALERGEWLTAKDLEEWMTAKDSKPTMEQALSHPFFWQDFKKLNYIERVGNQPEAAKCQQAGEQIVEALNQLEITGKSYVNWRSTMKDLVMKKDPTGKSYPDNPLGLLRFLRNMKTHCVDEFMDAKPLEQFPDLIPSIFRVAEHLRWNHRNSLKDFFEVDGVT